MKWLEQTTSRGNAMRWLTRAAANITTVCVLICGMLTLMASHDLNLAFGWIVLAAVLDTLDGTLARCAGGESAHGALLDIAADWMAFGAAPVGLIILQSTTLTLTRITLFGLFLIAAMTRLIRTATLTQRPRGAYVGLPMPAAGGLLASVVLLLPPVITPLAVLLTCALMLSRRPYPTLAAVWGQNRGFVLIPLAIFGALCTISVHAAVLFVAVGFSLLPWLTGWAVRLDSE